MKEEEINKAVDQVIESQKINGLSPEGFRVLTDLRRAFESNINYIDQIFFGEDIKTALGYILRDWNISQYQRNEVIVHAMETLQADFNKMKDDPDE